MRVWVGVWAYARACRAGCVLGRGGCEHERRVLLAHAAVADTLVHVFGRPHLNFILSYSERPYSFFFVAFAVVFVGSGAVGGLNGAVAGRLTSASVLPQRGVRTPEMSGMDGGRATGAGQAEAGGEARGATCFCTDSSALGAPNIPRDVDGRYQRQSQGCLEDRRFIIDHQGRSELSGMGMGRAQVNGGGSWGWIRGRRIA